MEEIEVKYRLSGSAEQARLRERLRAAGARPGGRMAEENVLFDRPDGVLRRGDCVLRVRVLNGGPVGVLTYKGPAQRQAGLKQRTEWESPVGDAPATCIILEGLGYRPMLRYAKEREVWHLAGTEVALDALAFGWFCEIEGTPETIRRVVDALGLADRVAEPASYPQLMAQHQAAGLPPAPP
jgi:predicted adenylyl cyclase CyaB